MRVLHVLEAMEAGVSRHVADLIRHVPADHEVLAPPERVGGFTDVRAFEAFGAAGVPVHLAPLRRMPPHPGNARAALALRRLIRDRRPDIVHGHASIGGALARVVPTGTPAARVYTPHSLLPSRPALALERALGRMTDALIAVSGSEAELIARERIVPAERIHVIPNGIELAAPAREPAADLRARLAIGPEVPLVGMVARLAEQKAPEVFVDACASLARRGDARFVLIGDGPARRLVAERIEAAGLGERMLHVAGLPDAWSVMPQLDAFALPSRYEAGPYAPLEAMRAGVPVVLTDVVGNRDTVVAGETGLLVPPDSPAALADAIARLLGDRELAGRLVSAARARLEAEFAVERMAERTLAVYGSVRR
jgi:glycosyltransferase involved in cell wall biosynthesis